MPDGRVAFLDFGMTKHLDDDQIELEIAALEAVFDDPEELRVAARSRLPPRPRKVDAELLMEHVQAVGGWYMEDRDVTIDSYRVMEAIAAVSDPRSSFYRLMRRENLPANELMGRRMESGVLAVLEQPLNATRNWYRIGREWWFGDAPATELGEQGRVWARSGSGGAIVQAPGLTTSCRPRPATRIVTSTALTVSTRLMPCRTAGALAPPSVTAASMRRASRR